MYFGACLNPVTVGKYGHKTAPLLHNSILHGLLSFRVFLSFCLVIALKTSPSLEFFDLFLGVFYFLVHFSHSGKIIYTPLVSCWTLFPCNKKRRKNELFEVIRVSPFRKCSNLRKDVLLLLQWLGILGFFWCCFVNFILRDRFQLPILGIFGGISKNHM